MLVRKLCTRLAQRSGTHDGSQIGGQRKAEFKKHRAFKIANSITCESIQNLQPFAHTLFEVAAHTMAATHMGKRQ